MTNSDLNRDSAVMISSAMPSAKYSCSGSPLMFSNGSTAMDGLSGSGRAWVVSTGGFIDVAAEALAFILNRHARIGSDIVFIDYDVTNVDTNAKFDPPDLRHRCILLSHIALDFDGAARCIDAGELGKQAIARVLDDLATMFADLGVSEATQTLPEPDVCPFLVQAGQATISNHIGRKDSCKPPFNAIVGQNGLPRSVDPSDISKHRALP